MVKTLERQETPDEVVDGGLRILAKVIARAIISERRENNQMTEDDDTHDGVTEPQQYAH